MVPEKEYMLKYVERPERDDSPPKKKFCLPKSNNFAPFFYTPCSKTWVLPPNSWFFRISWPCWLIRGLTWQNGLQFGQKSLPWNTRGLGKARNFAFLLCSTQLTIWVTHKTCACNTWSNVLFWVRPNPATVSQICWFFASSWTASWSQLRLHDRLHDLLDDFMKFFKKMLLMLLFLSILSIYLPDLDPGHCTSSTSCKNKRRGIGHTSRYSVMTMSSNPCQSSCARHTFKAICPFCQNICER